MKELSELVQLWKRGAGPYSRGFLAAMICRYLGRFRRVVETAKLSGKVEGTRRSSMAGTIPNMIREIGIGDELLGSDPWVARLVLDAVDLDYALRLIHKSVDENRVASLFSDEDPGDDAIDALFILDQHLLMAEEVGRVLPSTATASCRKLRTYRHALRSASRLVRQRPEAFLLWQDSVRAYCEFWGVASDNPLYAIGFPSWKALRVWAEIRRAHSCPEPGTANTRKG